MQRYAFFLTWQNRKTLFFVQAASFLPYWLNSSGLHPSLFRTAKIVIFHEKTKPQGKFFSQSCKKNFHLDLHFFALRLGYSNFFSYLCSAKQKGLLNTAATAADAQKNGLTFVGVKPLCVCAALLMVANNNRCPIHECNDSPKSHSKRELKAHRAFYQPCRR